MSPRGRDVAPKIGLLTGLVACDPCVEIEAAALQYVRKVAGSTKPSRANQAAYDVAISEITATTQRLLGELTTSAAPLDRDEFAAAARARAVKRYA